MLYLAPIKDIELIKKIINVKNEFHTLKYSNIIIAFYNST